MTFPKLPIQWSENGYEITEELGHGSYGSVYKLVKDKGTENEEVSALKIINWTLDNFDLLLPGTWIKKKQHFFHPASLAFIVSILSVFYPSSLT